MTAILTSVLDAIGRTPLVRLRTVVPDGAAEVLVKLEGGNPTGSYKDRMALAMIEGAERRGDARPGRRVVEYTGGSTGSSLAFVCAVKGYPLTRGLVGRVLAREAPHDARVRRRAHRRRRATAARITPDLFVRMRAEVDRIVERDRGVLDRPVQQPRRAGRLRRARPGDLAQADGPIDAFCAARRHRRHAGRRGPRPARGRRPRVVALEPDTSPSLTAGSGGPHRVEGTATGIVPPLLARRQLRRGARRGRASAPGRWPSGWPGRRACSPARRRR